MKRALTFFMAVAFLASAPMLAGTKEEIIRLQRDVLQLQEQIMELQKSMDERNGKIISLLEQLNDQAALNNVALKDLTQGLRSQNADFTLLVKEITGQFEALAVKLDDTNSRVAGLHQKIDERNLQMQQLRNPVSGEGPIEPDQVFFAARTDYQMGNYELAAAGFQDFLTTYPEHELADNAAYYLADSYLKQNRFELAVQTFDQVIQLYPDGDKVPVAYFKKAQALEQMQQMTEAIETYQQLSKLFPESQEARLAEAELQKLGLD